MSFCFCTDQKDVAKNIYVVVDQELGGGELSLSVCPVVGNRPPTKKKILQIPGGVPGEGGRVHGFKYESIVLPLPPTYTHKD